MRHFLYSFILFFILIFTLLGTNVFALDIAKSKGWLANQVNAGTLETEYNKPTNALALRGQSAKEICNALGKHDGFSQNSILKPFVGESNSTEILTDALVCKSLYNVNIDNELHKLSQRQNSDGGFGHDIGYGSTILDTALVLEALASVPGASNILIASAINFLVYHQKDDGSWQDILGDKLYVSSVALRSLWLYRKQYDVPNSMQSAVEYLDSEKNADGSYGNEIYESALVLRSIAVFSYDNSTFADTLSMFDNAQKVSGSWEDDIYTTALVLQALGIARNSVPNPDLTKLSGSVVDGDTGVGLPNINIILENDKNLSTTTLSDGKFSFSGLKNDVYTLHILSDNYAPLNTTFKIVGDDVELGKLKLNKNINSSVSSLKGIIKDQKTGKVLAGVEISIGIHKVITDIYGYFSIDNIKADSYTIKLKKPGYLQKQQNITIFENTIYNYNASLGEVDSSVEGTIKGFIVDFNMTTPMEDVLVELTGVDTMKIVTSSDGKFIFSQLGQGNYQIKISKDGYRTQVSDIVIEESQIINFDEIRLEKNIFTSEAVTLKGIVTEDITGKSLQNVFISVGTLNTFTDDNGSYKLKNIEEGTLDIKIEKEGYKTVLSHTIAVKNSTIIFSPVLKKVDTSTLNIVVIDGATGEYLVGSSVSLKGVNRVSKETNSTGACIFENLKSGKITISTTYVGYKTLKKEFLLHENKEHNIAITLYPNDMHDAIIQGTVVDAVSGKVINGAKIILSGANNQNTVSQKNGAYSLSSLSQGDTNITIKVDGYSTKYIETVVEGNETLDFVHNLYPEDFKPASFKVKIVDAVTNIVFKELAIKVSHSGLDTEYITDANGTIEVQDIIGNNIKVEISLNGYISEMMEFDVSYGELYDAGIIKLFRNGITSLEPDLFMKTIKDFNISTNPVTLRMQGHLSVVIANQGSKIALPFEVSTYFDENNDGKFTQDEDILVSNTFVNQELSVGESETLSFEIDTNASYRDQPLSIWIDSIEAVEESNEVNNFVSVPCMNYEKNNSETTYTFDNDFDKGSSINIRHLASHQLQLDEKVQTFDVIWVAASAKGTIVKINTKTGEILGEYRTSSYTFGSNPSRTTVDKSGNVWAGNRNDNYGGKGSVVKIGLVENGQCVDRNGNGIIDTSTGLGDVKAWGEEDKLGGVEHAEDECIIQFVRVDGTGVRHVSVDRKNNVWVGGYSNRRFNVLDGNNGSILHSFTPGCGGYGGLMDINDVLWSAKGGLLRYDTKGTLDDFSDDTFTCLGINSYGLGSDSYGNIWLAPYGSTATKLTPNGEKIGTYSIHGSGSSGLTVGLDNDVWTANRGTNNVTRLGSDGTFKANVHVGGYPTGAATDSEGKIWVSVLNDDKFVRIDPKTNEIDKEVKLRPGSRPYNYSDMTGSLLTGSPDAGTWSITKDSGNANTQWSKIYWTDYLPDDANLTVKVLVSDDGINFSVPKTMIQGDDINATGRYIRIDVYFTRASNGESPVLYDLSIKAKSTDYTISLLQLIEDKGLLSLKARIGNGGSDRLTNTTKVVFYDGNPEDNATALGEKNILSLHEGEYVDITLENITVPISKRIYALVDPNNNINECNENNNRMDIPVSVYMPYAKISVMTNKQKYTANELSQLQAQIQNLGKLDANLTAQLILEDSDGNIIHTFNKQSLGMLASNETKQISNEWNTTDTLAGEYLLRGVLTDVEGKVVDESNTSFSIVHSGLAATLDLRLDRSIYRTSDSVGIDNFVQSMSSNKIIENSSVELEITDSSHAVVYTQKLTLGTLLPQSTREAPDSYGYERLKVGNYSVKGILKGDDNVTYATDSKNFKIQASLSAELKGSVEVAWRQSHVGTTQQCSYDVSNLGSSTLDNLALQLRVIDMNTSALLKEYNTSIEIESLQTKHASKDIATLGYTPREYSCGLYAHIDTEWILLDHKLFTLTNTMPHAQEENLSTIEDTRLDIELHGSDVDGDTLHYSIVADPLHGTLSGSAPNMHYMPNLNYVGSDSFRFKVNDGIVDSVWATVHIVVHKDTHIPKAKDDRRQVQYGQAIIINVLQNDNIAKNDVNLSTMRLMDKEDNLVTQVDVPNQGTWKVTENGDIVFAPINGYVGDPTPIAYSVEDYKGNTLTAKIYLNYPPVAYDDHATTLMGQRVEIMVLDNDRATSSTLDNESIRFIEEKHESIELVSVDKGEWVVNTDRGSVVFTPEELYTGEAKAKYVVYELGGDKSNEANITVEVKKNNTIRPTVTPTPTPAVTPTPTVTPCPTKTPCPTITPIPTVTPCPTPKPTPTVTPTPTDNVSNDENISETNGDKPVKPKKDHGSSMNKWGMFFMFILMMLIALRALKTEERRGN